MGELNEIGKCKAALSESGEKRFSVTVGSFTSISSNNKCNADRHTSTIPVYDISKLLENVTV